MANEKPEATMQDFDYDLMDATRAGTASPEAKRAAFRTGLHALRMRRRQGLSRDAKFEKTLQKLGQEIGRPINLQPKNKPRQ